MLRLVLITLCLTLGTTAQAACFADYKAKKDNPLRLHYGVAQVASCNRSGAETELRRRLEAEGWTLLNVLGVFDEAGLPERKDSAGRYYLRF